MSEMIERVARAIYSGAYPKHKFENDSQNIRDHYREVAREVIAAMREPTDAMINSPMARCYNDGPYADKEVRRIFSAMIDVALAPHNH